IRDEDSNLLRDTDFISGRWERYFSTLQNAISATIDRTIVEKIARRPIALSLGDPPSPSGTEEVLRAVSNGKVTCPDGIPAEIPKLGPNGEASKILYHFHDIVSAVWTSGEVPQDRKYVIIEVLHINKRGSSVVSTEAFHLWHILPKFSSKS
ncbi:unnamed protein product, partial [Sphacelaria rigidula]